MIPKKIIILSGGLGNQLFQYCFAHYLMTKGTFRIQLYAPRPKDNARNFILHPMTKLCLHLHKVRLRRSWKLDISMKLRGFIQARSKKAFKFLFLRNIYIENNAYDFTDIDNSSRLYSGYFQNWNFVVEVLPIVRSEILEVFSQSLSPVYSHWKPREYGVLHYRRGDLLNFPESMGVLKDEYFLDAISLALHDLQRQARLIVLTDDKEAGVKTFANFAVDVYGPSEVNEWEALNIMSNAAFVITSNSTFSWWGALLASENGGTGYIPSPWFRDWSPDPGSAFDYPLFKKVTSKFY